MVTAVAALGPLPARTLDGGPPYGESSQNELHELALDADDHLVVDRFVRAGLLSPGGAWEVRVVAEVDAPRRVG
ncbi:hypothetical protein BN12_760006 [Nostocoides japonicum T1-X7]|uniref:Uncharacterized protein n=2 Tax=Nostocoides japonicum TaxID=99481 RepID=A0A077M4X4_9MICO|nr:hypothetical protein BN12_760006 [Tetrasphaera japonica T1-X7]